MDKRKLGRSEIEVSALGLGCWAIGGPFNYGGIPDGWGNIDDEESIRAIRLALDRGVNFIDTSDAYGVGHSEYVIGRAVKGMRDKVVIATKFGNFGSQDTKDIHGTLYTSDYIERACEASLRRLGTDYIDLYQLHVWEISLSEIPSVCEALERLIEKGKIRTYGWSTDLVGGAAEFAKYRNCSTVQHVLNIFDDAPKMLELCAAQNLASINRTPFAMGMLTGKFSQTTMLPKDDVRGAGHAWVRYFKDGKPVPEFLDKIEKIRRILTDEGRTLAQGSLAWNWARSPHAIPIPGFKNRTQVEENTKALEFGPLNATQMSEIESIMER
jgi:aryl-alcohol dehydrogenase-like predicted oxidoreductase